MFDWNDLKAFLSVARGGSTLAAAKALNINQTTVARRLESLEAALGLKLVDRGQSGSRLTEAGADLLAQAERVEAAAKALESRARAHGRGLTGTIRITCIELLASLTLTPAIAEFRKLNPEVQIDLIITDQQLDIEAGEADLAIRSGRALPVSNLVARKIAEYPFALYCSREYAARKGVPATPQALKDHDLVGGGSGVDQLAALVWMFEQAGGKAPISRSNTLTSMFQAVRVGLGIAPMPCVVGEMDATLLRCSEPITEAVAYSWIVMRRELKDTPRIRAFIDFLVPFTHRDMKRRGEEARAFRETLAATDTGALSPSGINWPLR